MLRQPLRLDDLFGSHFRGHIVAVLRGGVALFFGGKTSRGKIEP